MFKSKVGMGLCLIYALIIVVCLANAYGADSKGEFVLMQLPIGFQMQLVPKFLSPMLENLSWLNAYFIFATPAFLLLYFLGWFLETKSSSYNKKLKNGSK
jgi:hypothetical protein